MLELQNIINELNKFEFYILNSSGGFVVWECNEYLPRHLIEKDMKKHSQITFIDVMNLARSKYLNLFDIRDNKLNRKKYLYLTTLRKLILMIIILISIIY